MELVSNAYLAAFLLGALHALEVDHMIAVNAFVGSETRVGIAASFGARWGVGHSAVVVVVGGVLAWFGVTVPESAVVWGERGVGVALVLLGLWALKAAGKLHIHAPDEHEGHGHLHHHSKDVPGHIHSHLTRSRGRHKHIVTAMGALHGLVGTAPVLALVPVTLIADFRSAIAYLVLFSLGTVLSMTSYAGLAAMAVKGLGASRVVIKAVSIGIAVTTIGVGVWWVLQSMW